MRKPTREAVCGYVGESNHRFQRERKIGPQHMGVGIEPAAAVVELAVDFYGLHCPAKELFFLPEQDYVPFPFAADDVVLPLGAQDAGFRHQQDAVHMRLGAVAADHFQPGGGGEDVRFAEAEADPFAKFEFVAIGQ